MCVEAIGVHKWMVQWHSWHKSHFLSFLNATVGFTLNNSLVLIFSGSWPSQTLDRMIRLLNCFLLRMNAPQEGILTGTWCLEFFFWISGISSALPPCNVLILSSNGNCTSLACASLFSSAATRTKMFLTLVPNLVSTLLNASFTSSFYPFLFLM